MTRPFSGTRLIPMLLVVVVAACEVSAQRPNERAEPAGTRAMMPSSQADSIAGAIRDATTAAFATGAAAATGIPALYAPDAVLSDGMN